MDSCKRRGGDRAADSAPNSAPSPDLVLSSSAGGAASIAAPPPPKLTEAGDDPLASTTVPAEMAASFSSVTTSDDDGSLKKRETWNRNIDFLLACIGFSVGLGNVWRFPYLCYKNGGGAFLIPYFICVIVGGIPMFFLEVALGQFMSEGGIGAWKICPLLQGIGFATTMIVFLLNVYYNVILAWALRYLFASFTSVLPWSHCDNEWNTPSCVVRRVPNSDDGDAVGGMMSYANGTGSFGAGVSEALTTAASGFVNVTLNKTTDPVTEYWERRVLRISAGIGEVGGLRWDLAACLLLAWVIIYFCIWKGIKSSGKVMYFTATSPYLLMFILLIRGLTLPGAMEGVKFYLIPDWARLMDHQVWVDAGTQIFFSYSISIGALTALGSYNKYHHNCWRHSVIFACTNSGTSLFAGFVIFSVLGFMAHEQGVGVGEVAESGPGLAFIAYPKAVAQMPVSPIWSILFFLMVILLGLDSQFVGVEGFVTAVVDIYARHLRKGYRRELFILVVCIVSFLIGLSMVTNGGMYVFQLFDYYSGSRIILLVAFFECVAISYIYGVRRFYDNIESMLGYRLNPYMQISWAVTTPIFTLMMFTLCIYSYSELTYNRTYTYPTWAISIGWSLASSSVIMIPAVAVYNMLTTSGSFTQRLQKLTRPRLRPHQLRPDDDPKDLIDYCQTYGSHNLDNVKVIGAKSTDQHPLTSPIDNNTTTLPEPTEEDSLTKLPPDDYDTILQGAEEEDEGAEEYNDDVHVPINPPPASNVSPNKWGPKKG